MVLADFHVGSTDYAPTRLDAAPPDTIEVTYHAIERARQRILTVAECGLVPSMILIKFWRRGLRAKPPVLAPYLVQLWHAGEPTNRVWQDPDDIAHTCTVTRAASEGFLVARCTGTFTLIVSALTPGQHALSVQDRWLPDPGPRRSR